MHHLQTDSRRTGGKGWGIQAGAVRPGLHQRHLLLARDARKECHGRRACRASQHSAVVAARRQDAEVQRCCSQACFHCLCKPTQGPHTAQPAHLLEAPPRAAQAGLLPHRRRRRRRRCPVHRPGCRWPAVLLDRVSPQSRAPCAGTRTAQLRTPALRSRPAGGRGAQRPAQPARRQGCGGPASGALSPACRTKWKQTQSALGPARVVSESSSWRRQHLASAAHRRPDDGSTSLPPPAGIAAATCSTCRLKCTA